MLPKGCQKIKCDERRTIALLSFEELLALPIEIPLEQRIVDSDKVAEIVKYQKKLDSYNFMGNINVHIYDKCFYLIDGQHRYFAIKKLKSGGNVSVEFIDVEKYNEMVENYKRINMNTPLPEFPPEIKKTVPEIVSKYFFERYPAHWSQATKPQRPNFNKNTFQEAVGYLTRELGTRLGREVDAPTVQRHMDDYNAKLGAMSVADLNRLAGGVRENSPFYLKCVGTGFFFGLFKLTAKEYIYKWTLEITRPIIVGRRTAKRAIPRPIREACWDKYIGRANGEAPCICCGLNRIVMRSFHCGHVVAEANGGPTTVENLRPICATCNTEMGTTHMREYIAKHYEVNLAAFDRMT